MPSSSSLPSSQSSIVSDASSTESRFVVIDTATGTGVISRSAQASGVIAVSYTHLTLPTILRV